MAHNIYVAGAPRQPGAFGIHLHQVDTIADNKVTKVLKKTEEKYPLLGSSLVPIFFPGGMRIEQKDQEFWQVAEERRQVCGLKQLGIRVEAKEVL